MTSDPWGIMIQQPCQPLAPVPKPSMSLGRRPRSGPGGVLAALIVIGAIGNAASAGKKAPIAGTAAIGTLAAAMPVASRSVTAKALAARTALAAAPAGRPAPPTNGGSYLDATAVLGKLAATGMMCPSPSAVASVSVFYPGATSLTACDSPGGTPQDTSAHVFGTAPHVARYVSDAMRAPLDATVMLAGENRTLNSTNFGYVQRARTVLGGKNSYVAASTAELSTGPALSAAQQAFAGEMTAAGFESGTPAWILDADGEAVCGALQTQSMTQEVAYEESVDENAVTGMTTNSDIVKFIRWSVLAWCPQYAAGLPS